ncbi:cytochrome b5 [Manihot esculenta]|uniref:Uncharacterized protein n=1 Tax=Manihot esculenta TaxID=3983 RepID=A0ACB7I9R8_MANES|nr:cytochrome b5 [Manihot esculenta]KAG8661632.1 hypothetical protein MANES_01G026500v8 [Manihot esculenta]
MLQASTRKHRVETQRRFNEREIFETKERFLRETKETPVLNSMPTLTKLYTMHEASQHKTKEDCWIVIDGKVYDVSSYLDEHPGGDDVVLATIGKDAADDFEDAGHSESARELLQSFCIGELDTSAPVIPELEISSKKQPEVYYQKLKDLTKQYWEVPVAIVGISVVVGFLYLRRK